MTIPERPKWNKEMLKELSEKIGRQVHQWCNDGTDLAECVEDTLNILDGNIDSNAYVIAKDYEDAGYLPDAELVDILDSVFFEKTQIHRKHTKIWVKENGLVLDLNVGQRVILNIPFKGDTECEIVKLYPNEMKYGIWYESNNRSRGKWHQIVKAEDIGFAKEQSHIERT